MAVTDLSPVQRFLVNARQIALARPANADYRLYERLKADLQRIVTDSGEYQRACAELARMCGVERADLEGL